MDWDMSILLILRHVSSSWLEGLALPFQVKPITRCRDRKEFLSQVRMARTVEVFAYLL